jgi:hypothetical protein
MQVAGPASIASQLEHAKNLRVRRLSSPGAWSIKLPMLPWKFRAAKEDRLLLVKSLAEKFPFLGLWSKVDSTENDALQWAFPSPTDFLPLLESLDEGCWALLFFDGDRSQLQGIPTLPTDAHGLTILLGEFGARAVIVSWFDDAEWILAIKESSAM